MGEGEGKVVVVMQYTGGELHWPELTTKLPGSFQGGRRGAGRGAGRGQGGGREGAAICWVHGGAGKGAGRWFGVQGREGCREVQGGAGRCREVQGGGSGCREVRGCRDVRGVQ